MQRLLILPIFFLLLATFANAAERPNILYIYVDDMGWGAIGPNGQWDRAKAGQPHVITPNLDRIARRGVNFPHAYGAAVCSPARSSQQTGFHQGHTFADRNDPDNAKKAIRKDDITMGDVLSTAGYTTAYWGKWGYGGSKDQPAPTIDNVQTLPTSHGYQHVVAELHHVRAHTFFQPTLWAAPVPKGAKAHAGGLFLTPNSMQPWTGDGHSDFPARQHHEAYPKVAYCDDVYAFSALDFVRREAQSNAPFFGLLAFQVPHAPFGEIERLPDWDEAYRDSPFFAGLPDQAKHWAAMVTRIDGHIGNLLAALEDPNGDGNKDDSVSDNTLIIFQSDNGGPQQTSNKIFDANGGLSGGKGSVSEGGIRVPTMMAWPKHIKAGGALEPGGSCDRLIDVTDLLPTFCELAGHPAPLGVDGVSFVPTLTGKGWQRDRPYVIHESGRGNSVIFANGDKFVRGQKKGKGAKADKAAKPGNVVYNVRQDPAEQNALKAAKKVERFEQILNAEHAGKPAGQATTYHRWTAKSGGAFSDAENWSTYTYENAGITYTEQGGAPAASWIARVRGADKNDEITVAKNANLLALAVSNIRLKVNATLNARNELRIGDAAMVRLERGSQLGARLTKIDRNGGLFGWGRVDGSIRSDGFIASHGLEVSGALILGPNNLLSVAPEGLAVTGPIKLGGTLKANAGEGVIIKSSTGITGQFSNQILTQNGKTYVIKQTAKQVSLTLKK